MLKSEFEQCCCAFPTLQNYRNLVWRWTIQFARGDVAAAGEPDHCGSATGVCEGPKVETTDASKTQYDMDSKAKQRLDSFMEQCSIFIDVAVSHCRKFTELKDYACDHFDP